MSNRCLDEYKEIKGFAPERNAIESVKRWVEKANENTGLDLNSQIDKFFSFYVAYNIIYSLLSKNKKWDRCSAVNVVAHYIKNETLNTFSENNSTIAEMMQPIKNGKFYIYTKEDTYKDTELISNIEKNINKEESILNLLYGMRCNMFHGQKELSEDQLLLLTPANKILDDIIQSLISSITINWD